MKLFCNKCGQELPDDSLFCQYCGAKIEQSEKPLMPPNTSCVLPKTKKKIGKKGISLIALGIVLMGLISVIAVYFVSYNKAIEYVCDAEFIKANEALVFPKITEIHDQDLMECIQIGKDTQDLFFKYNKLSICAENGNEYASEVLEDIKYELYCEAGKRYTTGNYSSARCYFEELGDYKDSKNFCLLSSIKDHSWKKSDVESMKDVIEFNTMKYELVSYTSIAIEFLRGTWRTMDGEYYLKTFGDELAYNLPASSTGYSYYSIEDGRYYLHTGTLEKYFGDGKGYKTKDVFKFNIKDADTINVYCYKNGQTYTLYRQ